MTGGIAFLRQLLAKYNDGDKSPASVASCEADITTTYVGMASKITLFKNYFRGIAIQGVTNSTQFNTVYRRRITAATVGQVNGSFVGAKQIWTTGEVTAFEGTPAIWWFQLPANLVWLKVPPAVNTVAGQKTEITYHYMAAASAWSGNNTSYGAAPLVGY